MKFNLGALLLLLPFVTLTWADSSLKVGDPAPNFNLQGSDGKTHTLTENLGTAVVIAWFPKAFTGG
jgi:thioredoxin-dependent peroxiredoxin